MSTENEDQFRAAANDRIGRWRGAVELELQSLVVRAAETRKKIETAKTSTKKDFYHKKFKKITADVMKMVTTLERLQAQQTAVNTPEPSPDAVAEAPNELVAA